MKRISWQRLLISAMVAMACATLAANPLWAEDATQVAAVRYAPEGKYIKDHGFVFANEQWHLFAPLGAVGTSWEDVGSEESAEYMVSTGLVNWQHQGTAVAASGLAGYYDETMSGMAPQIIPYNGTYYMFHGGWYIPSKRPNLDMDGYTLKIGLATSQDLDQWTKPAEFVQSGLGVPGTDQCVVRDDSNGRWLMYTWTGSTPVYQSTDLLHWSPAVSSALTVAERGCSGESPFVMKHPISGKWMIFFHERYSVSDDPLDFPSTQPYPFEAGWHTPTDGVPPSGHWGDGTNAIADDDGAGYAHEIIQGSSGQWYMTGVVGRDGQTKLKFTPIEWTENSLRLGFAAPPEVSTKITVSAVSVNQTPAPGYPIERLIDDSGMSGFNLEVQAAEGYTLTGPWRQMNFEGVPNVIADAKITFDLGAVEDLSEMKVWNYSENADYGDYTKWGVEDFTLWSSIDGVDYTQVGSTHTLTQDDGVTNDSHDTISLTGVSARYLRMDLINIHAGIASPVNYGLGEVRFYAISNSEGLPGDANRDGKVDDADAIILAANWQMMSGASWAQGDFNNDGRVDDSDATILATNWQAGVSAGSATVPEPAVTVLLIGGLACCLLRRRVAK